MKPVVIILALAAAITAIPAWLIPPKQYDLPAEFADRYFGIEMESGEPTEVMALSDQVGSVTVTEWADGAPRTITVEQQEAAWVITTKDNYPADGENQIGRTAAAALGVEKLVQVTIDPALHGDLGVIDPSDLAVSGEEGRGTRVAITDRDSNSLVDMIVGVSVPERSGQRYAREVGSDVVFTAEIDGWALSSRFIDWVEPNPLEIEADRSRVLNVKNYSVDFERGQMVIDSQVTMTRANGDEEWVTDTVPEGQLVDQEAVETLVDTLAELRLANVKKRIGLGAIELQEYGILLQQNGIFADQGEIHVSDSLGFTYMLFFGKVADTTTGEADSSADATERDRILVVGVRYSAEQDDAKPVLAEDADEDAVATHQAELASHLQARREREQALNSKYSDFFYVIRDADFQTLRPSAATLFADSPAEEDAAAAPAAGAQGFPGIPGIPSAP